VGKQVDILLESVNRYSGVKPKRVLDVGCGPSPQLREFARRGYDSIGLYISPGMLAHIRRRAREEGLHVETVEGDMIDFRLGEGVDLALNFMGTISLVGSKENMPRHLGSVASALKQGGPLHNRKLSPHMVGKRGV
jgi:SAM-dependent methyltransferase